MEATYKTSTKTGKIEITQNEGMGLTLKLNNVTVCDLLAKMESKNNKLYIVSNAAKLKAAFPQLPDNSKMIVAFEICDLDGNSLNGYNILSIQSGARELTIENLNSAPYTIAKIRNVKKDQNKAGNFGTGCMTTKAKAAKYGYDTIEN